MKGPDSSTQVPVGTLLVTVFESITEVFILCLCGYILSRAGITDKATQRKMNVINVSLFTPALLFSKVAFSLTPAKLKEMWIIPLGFVIVTAVSALVAYALGTVFRLSRSQRAFAMCAAMFQNSNSLPIALIQSLVIEVPGLKWGHDDTKDQMLGRALTYLVLYSTLGMMFRWSYGVQLLSQADDEQPDVSAQAQVAAHLTEEPEETTEGTSSSAAANATHPRASETDPIMSSQAQIEREEREDEARSASSGSTANPWKQAPSGPGSSYTLGTTNGQLSSSPEAQSHLQGNGVRGRTGSRSSQTPTVGGGGRGASLSDPRRHSSHSASGRPRKPSRTESGRLFLGLPEYRKSHVSLSDQEEASDSDEDDQEAEDEEWGDNGTPFARRRQFAVPSQSRWAQKWRQIKTRVKHILGKINQFMTVPMYSALLSIFIALIPPLQAKLVEAKPLTQAIKSAGSCSIPMTLVVLGAFFYSPPPKPSPAATQPAAAKRGNFFERKLQGLKSPSRSHPGENRAVFVAVVSRMILVPLILLPPVALIARYDYFEAAEDPVFILAATLIISSPPALTLAQITQAASGDAFERLISKTISWSYAVLTPPLTLAYVVLGLVFGRL